MANEIVQENPSETSRKDGEAKKRPLGETATVLGILSGVAEILLSVYSFYSGLTLLFSILQKQSDVQPITAFILILQGAFDLFLGIFLLILFSFFRARLLVGGSPFKGYAIALLGMHATLAFYALVTFSTTAFSLATYAYFVEHLAGLLLCALLLAPRIDEKTKPILFYVSVGLYAIHDVIFIGTSFDLGFSAIFFLPLSLIITAFLVLSVLSVALEEKKK